MYDFRQEDDPNVAQLQSFIHHVVDEEIMAEDEAYKSLPPEEDLSLQQYMERLGYAPIVQRLVDAVVCNDWCNHISRIGLRELLSCEASERMEREERWWWL